EPDSCDDAILEATQIFLDELSASNFDRMSDRIIAWTNKWSMRDGRMLVSITQLVYRKATDDAASCVLCARLCRKMMEKMSSDVRDEETRDAEGKLVTGGQLFRKYLLESCKEDFERYCSSLKAQTTNTCDTQAISWTELEDGGDNELESPGGAHGPTQEAERRGLGTILFIGELFKVQMSTERIMHQCVQKLLGNVDNPAEEEIESVCKLLTTVGELLDTPRAHAHMDVYFARLKELTKKPTLSSRMQFMLQDLIELRAQDWRARAQTARPTPIAQIHEIAAEEKAAEEKDAMHRQYTNSRGDSERGGDRRDSEHVGPDGWTVAGPSALLPPVKAGGLSNSGNINKATPATFGPGSVFAGKNANKRDSISREASTFHASQSGGAEPVTAPQSGQPPSQKLSVDPSSAAG
ncbi:armadillo-type protein, partial [Schizophyllum commune]